MHGGEFVVPNRIFVGGIPKHVRFIEQFQLFYGFNLNFFTHNTKKVNENELKGFALMNQRKMLFSRPTEQIGKT